MPDARRNSHPCGGRDYVGDLGLTGPVDEALAKLATSQHGVAARSQLLKLGVSRRAIDRRLASGNLRALHRGVYAVGHEALSHEARCAAAALSVSSDVAVSHLSAAALHGLVKPLPVVVHVTATQPRTPRSGIVIHRAALPARDVMHAEGIPVTTVARTILDLSATLDGSALRRLIKQAEFDRLVKVAELAAILRRYPRRRGRRTLARIVDGVTLSTGRTRSELEDRFVEFCARRGLPLPETGVVLRPGGRPMEVDCLWRAARLVVELDGLRAHGGTMAFEDDRARDRALAAAGWTTVRITWAQLHGSPDTLELELRGALDAARRARA